MHRFQEVVRESQRLREENARISQQFDQMRTGLQTAVGLPNQPAVDPQVTRIREQLFQVFPELKTLVEKSGDVEKMLGMRDTLESHVTVSQQQLAATTFERLDECLTKHYKDATTGKLPPMVQRVFQTAFIDYLQNSPKAYERYLRNDRTLVAEWFAQAEAELIARPRRDALQQVERRGNIAAALPRVAPNTAVVPPAAPPKPKTRDELLDAAWEASQESRG